MSVRTIGRRKITVTIAAGPAATPISAIPKWTTDFEFLFPSGNASAVGFIGDSTVDATWIPRPKGEIFNFVHGDGNIDGNHLTTDFDLSKIFVLANAGDTCIVEFMDIDS